MADFVSVALFAAGALGLTMLARRNRRAVAEPTVRHEPQAAQSAVDILKPAIPSAHGWANKVVIITGASGGIGQAIARMLAREHCRLVLHFHSNEAAVKALAHECASLGSPAVVPVQADLSDPTGGGARLVVESAVERFGVIHVLVNNAGIYQELPVVHERELPSFLDIFQRTLSANLLSAAALTYLVGAHMATHPRVGSEAVGAIINVGSRGAFRGEPDAWAYGASKAGMHALGQSAAVKLGASGVVVLSVAPGFVRTPMAEAALKGERGAAICAQSAWDRVATPEEVAECVTFAAQYWKAPWVTGGIIDCNGASYLRS